MLGLSPKETEVISLIAQGFPNKEIASKMVISENTVKNYVSSIFRKIGCYNRTEVAIWYITQPKVKDYHPFVD